MYTIVTGATSDIGKQICITLSRAGHKLLLTDLLDESLIELCGFLEGDEHKYVSLDFSDVQSAKVKLYDFIKENNIAVRSAVFAAGQFVVSPLKMLNYEFCKKNFDIALFSIIQIMQIITDKRVNSKNLESVVLISSISAKLGTKGYSLYSAVKSAMLGLVHSWAIELAPQVRVNALLPGGIHTKATDFIYKLNPEVDKRYVLGEGKTTDVANATLFLLSDMSRWITGHELVVDGGCSVG